MNLRRKRLSEDSTDFRIIDTAAGEDLGRVDGKTIEAFLTTTPEDIRIYPPDFEPEKVKGSWKCKERHCDKHLMLPDGFFTPPMYEFARVVAGKRISITMGPRRTVLEGDEK